MADFFGRKKNGNKRKGARGRQKVGAGSVSQSDLLKSISASFGSDAIKVRRELRKRNK